MNINLTNFNMLFKFSSLSSSSKEDDKERNDEVSLHERYPFTGQLKTWPLFDIET